MPFRIRTKLLIAFLAQIVLLLTAAGMVGYYNQIAALEASQRVEAISSEMTAVGDLHLLLERILMPANDYIITGNRKYIADFHGGSKKLGNLLVEVEKHLPEMKGAVNEAVKEKMGILHEVKTAWQHIQDISMKIFAVNKPVGSREAAVLMEEMDYRWGEPAGNAVHRWHDRNIREYNAAVKTVRDVWGRSWIIMGGMAVILAALGVVFAASYSRLFVRPIEVIHKRADEIASGDFSKSIEVQNRDELGQLAGAINRMAGQLDGMYGHLEGMVAARTKELKESEERYRMLVDILPVGVAVHRDGKLLFINTAGARMLGAETTDRLIGRPIMEFVPPECKASVEDRIRRAGSGEKVEPIEEKFLRLDGALMDAEVNVVPIEYQNKPALLSTGIDITERRKMEAAQKKHLDELELFRKVTLQRELRMRELKDMVEELEKKLMGVS